MEITLFRKNKLMFDRLLFIKDVHRNEIILKFDHPSSVASLIFYISLAQLPETVYWKVEIHYIL